MGGASSSAAHVQQTMHHQPARDKNMMSVERIVALMMPIYYNPKPLEPAQRKLALDSWSLILDDKSPEFLCRKGTSGFPYLSCVTFFYDTFYTRLFDIHPMSKQLFKSGMKSQGKFLVKMISLALSELDDPDKFDRSLIKLAEIHYERGVKAVEYGVVGEVLFYVLKVVLGQQNYSTSIHHIWVKVYSRMLKTIVPYAVSLELKGGVNAAQTERFSELDKLSRAQSSADSMSRDKMSSSVIHEEEDDNQDESSLRSEQLRQTEVTKTTGSSRIANSTKVLSMNEAPKI